MVNIFHWIAHEYRTHQSLDRWLFVLGFPWILSLLFWIIVTFYATANYGRTFEENAPGYFKLLRGFGIVTALVLAGAFITLVVVLVVKP